MPICRAIPPPLGPNGRIGSFAACQTYIEGQERDRPTYAFFRGVISLDTAAFEMDAQADLSRCRDPVCHWVISYHADEPATNEMIEHDTRQLLKMIDLGVHQFIAAVHDDTDNRHVHVVANRVGFDGRAAQMSWYKVRSERCMAGIALERDVAIVPGKFNRDLLSKQQTPQHGCSRDQSSAPDLRARLSGRDRARLERNGGLPWYEIARPIVIEAAGSSADWDQFSAALSQHGIVCKHTVRISATDGQALHGLAFAEGYEAGAPGCKASSIGSGFRYKALAAQWGDYPDDAEGRARAALLARSGIPGRGEVVRSHAEGREAARQRRAKALGSTVALEAGYWMSRSRCASDNDLADTKPMADAASERYRRGNAESRVAAPLADFAPLVDNVPAAQRAAERILAGLRAKTVRARRRKRLDNLHQRRRGFPVVSGSEAPPDKSRRQGGGMLRARVRTVSGNNQFSDSEIKDNHALQEQYVAYRAEQRRALRASENEAWRSSWVQELAIRQQESDRLRQSERAKRRLIVEGLPSSRFRRIWLEGLKARYRYKRALLKKRQAERWATIRSEWTANRISEQPLGYKTWLRERVVADPVAARQYAWIDSMDARRAVAKIPPAAQGAGHDKRLIGLSEPDTTLPDRITSVEPGGQPEADPVSNSEVERIPVNRSQGDFRLLAAARFRVERAGDLNIGMVENDKGGAGSAVEAAPAVLSRPGIIDDPSVGTVSEGLPGHAGASREIAAPLIETAHVAAGAPLCASMDPNASGIEESEVAIGSDAEHQGTEGAQPSHAGFSIADQAREVELRPQTSAASSGIMPRSMSESLNLEAPNLASGVEDSEEETRLNTNVEHKGGDVTQVPQSTIDFRVQAREVSLRWQPQVAHGGIVPGSTSVELRQDTRRSDQAIEMEAPAIPRLPTTVERLVDIPKTGDRPELSHGPSDQGAVSAPSTGAASGPIRLPTPAPEPSKSKASAALQATVQHNPGYDTALADAGATTTQAPAPVLAPESLAPAAPPLAPANASDAAQRAATALRVPHPPIGPDSLREIVKAAEQSLDPMQAAMTPPAPASAQSDQPIQDEPFNPIEDENGQRRNPLLQQVAATIIHAFDRVDPVLQEAASILLGVCLDIPAEAALLIADKIVDWRYVTRAWPDMPPPLSVADCGKVTERIMGERQSGKGDDWMWGWKGLSPHRPPPRPNPGRVKGFGLND